MSASPSSAHATATHASPLPPEEPLDVTLTPRVLGAIAISLILAFAVLINITGDRGDTDTASATTRSASPSGPTFDPSTPATIKLPSFPGAPPGAPTDDFNRPEAPLGPPWTTSGSWPVRNDSVYGETPTDAEFSFAIRQMASGDGDVSAVAKGVAANGGMVFRHSDDENYFAFLPAPQQRSWLLVKVEKGKSAIVEQVKPALTVPGVRATVTLSGNEIVLKLNGREEATHTSPFNATATGAGFRTGATAGGMVPRWDDFYAVP